MPKLDEGKDCPNPGCENKGYTVVQTSQRQYVTRDMALDACDPSLEGQLYSDDEFEQVQCQWCHEIPDSKFNLALKQSFERGELTKEEK